MGADFDSGSWVAVLGVADNGELQDEVAAAEPSIDEKTNKLVSKGRWVVPGYKVRRPAPSDRAFPSCSANTSYRRGSATSRFYKQFAATFCYVPLLCCHCR